MYADIVFPLKLRPLTYRLPDTHPSGLKGRIVKAPLGRKYSYGIIAEVKDRPTDCSAKDLKSIERIYGHFTSESGLQFLKWLSDYYLAPLGVVLKSAFFEETVKAVVDQTIEDRLHKSDCRNQKTPTEDAKTENGSLSQVINAIKKKTYKTFLYHAASMSDEIFVMTEIMDRSREDIHGAMVLVPEIGQIERVLPGLSEIFGERVCVLHSRLTKKKRLETIEKIVGKESDLIIGTRSSVLAPLESVSFVAVLDEQNRSYKGEESPRYNGRDASVMKGFMEKSCVLLSSTCPSVESEYNSMSGKYTSLTGPESARPKIRVIDMWRNKQKDAVISGEVLKEAKETIKKKEKLLFLVNRKGYSLVKCDDCGHVAVCGKCKVPLIFSKDKGTVRCNYCGDTGRVPESCEECKGFHIKPFGSGTERVREEVGQILNAEAIVIEKSRKGVSIKDYVTPDNDIASFVVGTDYATRKIMEGDLTSAVLLNMDLIMSQPDFRAYERAFQEVARVSQLVRGEGSVLIQTWDPKNAVLKFIRQNDPNGFYRNELSQRRMLDYPPYSKIVLFNILSDGKGKDVFTHVMKALPSAVEGLEVLGPVEMPCHVKSCKQCFQLLFKSRDKKLAHSFARDFLTKIEGLKGLKISVDVDPLKI